MTFWDAGELIAAAHALGIPHPPGTPLYIAAGRAWSVALGPLIGVARSMNLLSAVCTALAGAGTAGLVARRHATGAGGWQGIAAAVAAGSMMTVWSNANETEVYAASLLLAIAILDVAERAGAAEGAAADRWLLACVYLLALAPAVHLSALVAVPAAIVLASHLPEARGRNAWRWERVLILGGTLLVAAGLGRMEWILVLAGAALIAVSAVLPSSARSGRTTTVAAIALVALAASAPLMLMVRARHDPAVNQGNPSSWSALADVVARRQYDVAPLLPRQAPALWQAINVFQYVDWQVAMAWGHGIMTSPLRIVAAALWLLLAWEGLRAARRESPTLALALTVLLLSGTAGIAAYLNLKAGSSLGWGILPADAPHEARERDYFYVLGFWAWGALAGLGALAVVRARGWPPGVGLLALLLPIAGNWRSADRSSEPEASAARSVARALLSSTPVHGVLFMGGDNDSYPVWYVQEVERFRTDVFPVTIPLLPAAWYPAELERRSGWRLSRSAELPHAGTRAEVLAGLVAEAARRDGRPVAASPTVTARERALLGGDWMMEGAVYVAESGRLGPDGQTATVDSAAAIRWLGAVPPLSWPGPARVDQVARVMLGLLQCARVGVAGGMTATQRDSLEVKCNLR